MHRGRAAGGSRAGDPCPGAGLVTYRVSRPASARPTGPPGGPTFLALFTGAARGLLAAHLPRLSGTAAVAVLRAAMAVPIGDGDVEAAELGLDPESRGWMDGLRSPAAERNAVLARLHGLLLHVARCETGRRNGWLCLSGPDRDDLARQAAADALRAITVQLDGFCGQSRFWNWPTSSWCLACRRRLAAASGRPGQPPSMGGSPRRGRARPQAVRPHRPCHATVLPGNQGLPGGGLRRRGGPPPRVRAHTSR